MEKEEFSIGQQFIKRQAKRKDVCTIIDSFKTFNSEKKFTR
jgi:hypothetical protein